LNLRLSIPPKPQWEGERAIEGAVKCGVAVAVAVVDGGGVHAGDGAVRAEAAAAAEWGGDGDQATSPLTITHRSGDEDDGDDDDQGDDDTRIKSRLLWVRDGG